MLSVENQKAILEYLPRLQAHVDADYAAFMPKHVDWAPKLSYKEGKRFVKVISTSGNGGSQSVFGFIEKETLLLWKAASWAAPALNFPRGKIGDNTELTCARWTGIS